MSEPLTVALREELSSFKLALQTYDKFFTWANFAEKNFREEFSENYDGLG